jgi:hypothetical protein
VGDLNARHAPLRFNEGGNARQHGDMFVPPDSMIARRDSAAGFHRRRFDHHQPRAADRAAPQMDQVPIVGKAVLAGILAHGRDGDAVAQGDVAKGDWRKKMRRFFHRISMVKSGKASAQAARVGLFTEVFVVFASIVVSSAKELLTFLRKRYSAPE